MIEGIGVDLIEIERIQALVAQQTTFPDRILTPSEQAIYAELSEHRQLEFLAGRFAAKEAFAKARGTGIGGETSFQAIDVLPDEKNKPILKTKLYTGNVHVSISHTKTHAVAQVVLENIQ